MRAGDRDPVPPEGYLPTADEADDDRTAAADGWVRGARRGMHGEFPAWHDGANAGGGAGTRNGGRLPPGAEPRAWHRRLVGPIPPGTELSCDPGTESGAVLEVIRLDAPFAGCPVVRPDPFTDLSIPFDQRPPDPEDPPPDEFDALDDGTLTPQKLMDWNAARLADGAEPVSAVFLVARWIPADAETGEIDWNSLQDLPSVEAYEERKSEEWDAEALREMQARGDGGPNVPDDPPPVPEGDE